MKFAICFLMAFQAMANGTPDTPRILQPDWQGRAPQIQAPGGVGPVREANDCAIALLPGGQDNFMVRYQAMARAKKSINLQALIFRADEAGLAYAELLKKKAREGVQVRVIVDAMSNLELQTQLMYFDMWKSGVEIVGWDLMYLEVISELFNPNPRYTLRSVLEDRRGQFGSFVELVKDAVRGIRHVNVSEDFIKAAASRLLDYEQAVLGDLYRDVEVGVAGVFSRSTLFSAARLNMRYHDKLITIDSELLETSPDEVVAFDGGLNMAKEYFRIGVRPENFWTDQDNVVRGLLVKDLNDAFNNNYNYMTWIKRERILPLNAHWRNKVLQWSMTNMHLRYLFPVKTGRDLVKALWGSLSLNITQEMTDVLVAEAQTYIEKAASAPLAHSLYTGNGKTLEFVPSRARFIHHRPRFGETNGLDAYLDSIRTAHLREPKEVLIANAYFTPTQEFIDVVREAAKKGVRFKFITNSMDTNDLAPLSILSRFLYKILLDINSDPEVITSGGSIDIYEWGSDATEGTLHAKYAVFNRRLVIIGSFNLDERSFYKNSETLVAFMDDEDRNATAQANLFFKHLGNAQKVSTEQALQWHNPQSARDAALLALSRFHINLFGVFEIRGLAADM